MKDRTTDKFFSHKNWREQLQILVRCNSFAEAERMFLEGRIGARCWEAYCRVWSWTAARFGGRAGERQEAFWAKHGKAAFYAKVNKTRCAFGFEPLKGVQS